MYAVRLARQPPSAAGDPPTSGSPSSSCAATPLALVSLAPTLGARVARAATIGRIEGAGAGLAALDEIEDGAMGRFQPAWATRAHLRAEAGRGREAAGAYRKAISLTTDPGMRRYLESRALTRADQGPAGSSSSYPPQ